MKREVDLFFVPAHQSAMHERLENWAAYVRVGFAGKQHPMWANTQSNSRQWHAPELRKTCDTLDGHLMEKAVAALPVKHKEALRWYYVTGSGYWKICRALGVSIDGLNQLVVDGRTMLMNRSYMSAGLLR